MKKNKPNRMVKTVVRGAVLIAAVALLGCKGPPPSDDAEKPSEASKTETAPAADMAEAATPAAEPKDGLPAGTTVSDAGFAFPGTVIVDAPRKRYIVSNAGADPLGDKNDGFISTVTSEGTVENAKWIEGGKNGTTLIAPKGMAVRDNILYVADVRNVRKFDVETGAPKGDIGFEKATYLNDIALGPDGNLYITDTGLTPEGGRLTPTNTDTIYVLDKSDKISTLASGSELVQPNGIEPTDDGFYVVSYASNKVLFVSLKGEVKVIGTLPADRLDGVVLLPNGELLISSWRGSTVFKGKPEGPFKPFRTRLAGPSDLSLDPEKKVVLIPVAKANALLIQPLPEALVSPPNSDTAP